MPTSSHSSTPTPAAAELHKAAEGHQPAPTAGWQTSPGNRVATGPRQQDANQPQQQNASQGLGSETAAQRAAAGTTPITARRTASPLSNSPSARESGLSMSAARPSFKSDCGTRARRMPPTSWSRPTFPKSRVRGGGGVSETGHSPYANERTNWSSGRSTRLGRARRSFSASWRESRAPDPKLATCRVSVTHDDLPNGEKLEDMAAIKVTKSAGP